MFELLYHPEAVQEVEGLPDILRGKMARLLDQLECRGNGLRFPLTRPIKDGLFELRASGADIARTLFVYQQGKRVFILRCFVKKSERTPPTEIMLALQRLEDLTDA
ncbi:type II toxin-antitoxin system RelE/ParE family toxin [Yersinia pekkanenii]|uniref:Phage-related protein n=1 Tax=Yersinia pekkanenii TaxID=1288385 RepID=A0A0T9PKB1_9GAMM|nr:type II toxin-antitoxin system RelE/ParE family toxin [Yersinia pekkanenii]CNH69867.1 Phage-related protein [Yersinia pekkanenii]CRY68163.1 Phage-related protein [Yersinia pekkanenii]